jgi:hypothetical protein
MEHSSQCKFEGTPAQGFGIKIDRDARFFIKGTHEIWLCGASIMLILIDARCGFISPVWDSSSCLRVSIGIQNESMVRGGIAGRGMNQQRLFPSRD